jgi:hypothetical protein
MMKHKGGWNGKKTNVAASKVNRDFLLFSLYFRGNTVQWNIDDNV